MLAIAVADRGPEGVHDGGAYDGGSGDGEYPARVLGKAVRPVADTSAQSGHGLSAVR
ncbi:hypothetical protein [Streptomyces sp. NPDC001970]